MARVMYGVWDGIVHDHRGCAPESVPEWPELRDFEQFNDGNPIRAFFGDRGFLIFDESAHLTDALWHYLDEAADQSCGKCTPCRMGTALVREALGRIRRGEGSALTFDEIEALGAQMAETSLCGLGARAPSRCSARCATSATCSNASARKRRARASTA